MKKLQQGDKVWAFHSGEDLKNNVLECIIVGIHKNTYTLQHIGSTVWFTTLKEERESGIFETELEARKFGFHYYLEKETKYRMKKEKVQKGLDIKI